MKTTLIRLAALPLMVLALLVVPQRAHANAATVIMSPVIREIAERLTRTAGKEAAEQFLKEAAEKTVRQAITRKVAELGAESAAREITSRIMREIAETAAERAVSGGARTGSKAVGTILRKILREMGEEAVEEAAEHAHQAGRYLFELFRQGRGRFPGDLSWMSNLDRIGLITDGVIDAVTSTGRAVLNINGVAHILDDAGKWVPLLTKAFF